MIIVAGVIVLDFATHFRKLFILALIATAVSVLVPGYGAINQLRERTGRRTTGTRFANGSTR
jgi:hypothetical protein